MNTYYYWLIPDAPHFYDLSQIIVDFARLYRGPLFDPHVTLGTSRTLKQPPPRLPPINLQFSHVASDDHPFRSLYYCCVANPYLNRCHKHYMPSSRTYLPHLSLLYGQHSNARRNDWVQNTPLYTHKITCSEIWTVLGGPKVEQWRVVEKHLLAL